MISLAELVEESISRSIYFEFGSQGHKVAVDLANIMRRTPDRRVS